MNDVFTRQMAGQRSARRLGLEARRRGGVRRGGSGRGSRGRRFAGHRRARLQLRQRQLELGDLAIQLLRRAPELHPAQPHQLHLQLLDLQRLGLEGRQCGDHQPLQAVDVVGKLADVLVHKPECAVIRRPPP
jgi:hypothetical protein